MSENPAIAIVGLGAILPDAPDVQTFWKNIQASRYSITDVTSDRWKAELFYNPDPSAPDKTYSKVGGWVRGFTFEPAKMGIAIPPRIQEQIDDGPFRWIFAGGVIEMGEEIPRPGCRWAVGRQTGVGFRIILHMAASCIHDDNIS